MARGDQAALTDPLTLGCHLDERVLRRPHLDVISSTIARVTPGGGDRVLVVCPPQVGKPVYVGAVILMGDGSRKPLGEVQVGDQVITHAGRPRRVTAVHEQGPLPTVAITTTAGRSTIANHDHPFLTPNGWVKAADLQVGDVLAAVPTPGYEPTSSLTAEAARLMGYFVGDGSTSAASFTGSTFSGFTTASEAVDADFRRCCETLGFTVNRSSAKAKGQCWALNVSTGVRPWLVQHGLARKTSHTKRVPLEVFTATPQVIAAFVGAYFDCDGTVSTKGLDRHGEIRRDVVVEFYSINRELLGDVQHLLLRLGIRSSVRVKNGRYQGKVHKSWRLQLLRTDDLARFRDLVPTVSEERTRRLRECNARRTEFDRPFVPDEIATIEDSGIRDCRCLTVEEDHTFTSDDLVVHNTWLACWSVFWWLVKHPDHRVIIGSYGTTLAGERGRSIRRMVETFGPRYGLNLLKGAKSVTNWSLVSGGGCRSAGVAAGITGNPADCVAHGTLIRTPQGEMPVERIVDMLSPPPVLSYNHDSGRTEWGTVQAVRRIPDRPVLQVITQAGHTLHCTPEHRVFTEQRGYVLAVDLRAGDVLVAADESCTGTMPRTDTVTAIRTSPDPDLRVVYDLQVADNNNFFANDVLVHNCFLIDDPVRSRADAESRIIRDAIWDWWSGDVNSRLAPGAPVILVQTRWHLDDLAGRLLAEEGTISEGGRWQVVYLPAFAVPSDADRGIPPDSLGRSPGQPLTHPKIDTHDAPRLVAHWEDKRRSATARDWAALWMGDPRPVEGALISRTVLRERHDYHPLATPIKHAIAVDPAGEGRDNVGIVAGWLGDDLRLYVSHDVSQPGGTSTEKWTNVVVHLAVELGADRIIYEQNYGRRLIERVITVAWEDAQRKGTIPGDVLMPQLVAAVAKKNKRLRAEPVAQLLVVDKIRFAAPMPEMEVQWTSWVPTDAVSPGNLDAMVYLAYNLLRPRRGRRAHGQQGVNPGSVSRAEVAASASSVLAIPVPRPAVMGLPSRQAIIDPWALHRFPGS